MSVPLSPPPRRPFETKEALIEWVTVTVKSEKKGEIKEPPNDFFCFRKWFNKFALPLLLLRLGKGTVADLERLHQSKLSRFLSRVWAHLPEDHRAFWKQVETDVKEYHLKRYPSFHSPESQAQREEEKRQRKEEERRQRKAAEGQPRKAKKSGNTKPSRRGRKRSPKEAVRSSPYRLQQVQRLPSSTIHVSNPLPLHLSTSPAIPIPSTPADAYTASSPAYHPVAYPAMYAPSPSSSMVAPSSFAIQRSFHPPSATLPFSAPLPFSSFFAPPLPQQHALPSAAPALPFPLTSTFPAPPAVFPPQASNRVTMGGYPSIPAPPNPQRSANDIDFFSFFEAPQAGATLGMPPLPMDNLFLAPGQQPTFEIPSTYFDTDPETQTSLPSPRSGSRTAAKWIVVFGSWGRLP
ncbi:hypothetical protein V8D89_001162 [Ganoderma adspersum]